VPDWEGAYKRARAVASRLFAEERPEAIAEAIRAARVGELVTLGPEGLEATLLPWLLRPAGKHGTLVGHLARTNPQWRHADPAVGALVLFRAADAYVSPSWYPSKREHGKVVPTWNYVVVRAWGRLVVHDDPDWVGALVRELTDRHEEGRDPAWSVDDAPGEFVRGSVQAIVGVEVPVERVQAKWKLSQNRSEADREGVMEGLATGDERDRRLARYMRDVSLPGRRQPQ
jgi:transcriptional regulator